MLGVSESESVGDGVGVGCDEAILVGVIVGVVVMDSESATVGDGVA